MGGGGGGDTVTNVTNTGLGDDQYQALADNQVGISGQITDARNDATVRYDNFDNRFDNLDTSVGGVSSNLSSGFTNLQDLMKEYNDSRTASNVAAFDTINTGLNANNAAIGQNTTALDTLSGDVTGGFDEVGQRFNTVDQANQNLQTSVDTGFEDQATAMNELETGMNTQFDDANTALNESFAATGEALQEGFGATSDQMTETQRNVLEGQGGLQTNLDALSGNVDTYANQQLANQEALAQGQSGFQSSFDNYVDRYTDDTTLANQTRADLATAQANATQRLRQDLGDFAQAAATGQQNLSEQIGDTATSTGKALGVLGDTVQGGFMATSTEAQLAKSDLATRLANLKAQGENMDAATKAQFDNVANSFDDQGNLITNSIDAQGNTITRQIDDQGNLIQSTFDATGQRIGQSQTNIQEALTATEGLLSGEVAFAQKSLDTGFNTLNNNVNTNFTDVSSAVDSLGTNLTQGQEGLMSDLQLKIDKSTDNLLRGQQDNLTANQQQIQAAIGSQNDNYASLREQILGGFQSMDVNSINQAKDLAAIAATQGDLDMGMRQNFKQLSQAFDDNGKLISNSVDEQGNTLSRAIDENGNLLLRSFDVTDTEIGNKVININRSLYELGNLQRMVGANISMGNLSPTSQGDIPTGGFASPFTMTQ
jgi:Flp pilus assembly pilin Flp